MGKRKGTSLSCMQKENSLWLEDCTVRFIRVLALDRFADFSSTNLIAPVRETCAQALGVILTHLSFSQVEKVLNGIFILQTESKWEIRHGGYLALKYLVTVRKDVAQKYLEKILSMALYGLQDSSDDVIIQTIEALLALRVPFILQSEQNLPSLFSTLWNCLLKLDDLSNETSHVMNLLCKFFSKLFLILIFYKIS